MVKQLPSKKTIVLIGSKSGTTRTAETLESTYDSSTDYSFEVGGYNRLNMDVLYTTGATETNNTIEIKIDVSNDGTNYYRLVNESASSGTSTLFQREFTFTGAVASTVYDFSIIMDINYKFMKVEAKETGVVSNKGTCYIEATLGVT